MQIEFSWASNIEKENRFFELRGSNAGATWNDVENKLKIKHVYGKILGNF